MCLELRREVEHAPGQAAFLIDSVPSLVIRTFLRSQTLKKLSFKIVIDLAQKAVQVISGEDLAKLAYLNRVLQTSNETRKRAASWIGLILLRSILKENLLLEGLPLIEKDCEIQSTPLSESKINLKNLLDELELRKGAPSEGVPSEAITERPVPLRAISDEIKNLEKLLLTKPRTPEKTHYQFDSKAQREYLDAFCPKRSSLGKLQSDLIQDILAHTQIVSHDEFLQLLDQTINQLLLEIGDQSWTPAGHLKEGKSNVWVLQLALERSPKLRAKMQLNPTRTENLVFWDDGIYSGQQMSNSVSSRVVSSRYPVYVVAPFMSMKGMAKIHSERPNTKFIFARILEPMTDKSKTFSHKAQELKEKFPRVPHNPLVQDLYPIILNHKMPDFISSYPAIYSGYVPALNQDLKEELKACPKRSKPQLIPYLSGCQDIFKKYFQTKPPQGHQMYEFQFSDLECPLRPYQKFQHVKS